MLERIDAQAVVSSKQDYFIADGDPEECRSHPPA